MKIARFQFLVLIASLALVAIGCSKDPVTPDNPVASNRVTLNGGGFANQKFTFPHAVGSHLTANGITAIAIGDSTVPDTVDAPGVIVFFKGSAAGTYTVNPDDTTLVIWVASASGMYALQSGTLVITEYGAIGGKITGTFSGTVSTDQHGDPISITVTDGAFSATRLADNALDIDDLDPTIDFSFVLDGGTFSSQTIDIEDADVAIDSVADPGVGVYRRFVVTGHASFAGKDWIVYLTLAPMIGDWHIGTFPWVVNQATGFHSAGITLVPVDDEANALTMRSDGTGGSTIILDMLDGTASGVFSGRMELTPTLQTYIVSNGRFKIDLP